jgi:hypothetical protein
VRRQVGPRTGGASRLWSPGRHGSIERVGVRELRGLGYVGLRVGQWVGKLCERLWLRYDGIAERLRVGEWIRLREQLGVRDRQRFGLGGYIRVREQLGVGERQRLGE